VIDVPYDERIPGFVTLVLKQGESHYRDFPWRHTRDPYAVLVSEIMLQQTQVARVLPYWERWLLDFPTLDALAAAPLEAILRAWQGLGYNRRAVALKRLAELLSQQPDGRPAVLPDDDAALRALPGVGPSTAAGVRAFAYGQPSVYLETNVRAVVLHELFADSTEVSDRELLPLLAQAAEFSVASGVEPHVWNCALLDYGAFLKSSRPNPSRRSAHHTRQTRFEGSKRQKRARLLRLVLEVPFVSSEEAARELGGDVEEAIQLLGELQAEGFVVTDGTGWRVN
jgi:A/G-specific adenine glycosylase